MSIKAIKPTNRTRLISTEGSLDWYSEEICKVGMRIYYGLKFPFGGYKTADQLHKDIIRLLDELIFNVEKYGISFKSKPGFLVQLSVDELSKRIPLFQRSRNPMLRERADHVFESSGFELKAIAKEGVDEGKARFLEVCGLLRATVNSFMEAAE